jgi:hypothetical protein
MFVSEEAFNEFLVKKGNVYPYCSILRTRRGFYPKWLLLRSKGDPGILFKGGSLFLTPSCCFPTDIMQSLILTGDALPLPPVFSEVAGCMHWWGRSISGKGYNGVLMTMDAMLNPNKGWFDDEPDKERVFHDCILDLIFNKVRDHHGYTALSHHMVTAWDNYFRVMFATKTHDYFELAVLSIRFTDQQLNLFYSGNIIPGSVVTATDGIDDTESL